MIIPLGYVDTFTLKQANDLVPILIRVTQRQKTIVDALIQRLEICKDDEKDTIERQVNRAIEAWQSRMKTLGAIPKGLWIADLDNGTGFYCWKYPEKTIEHSHSYAEGFSKRKLINS